jgi:uncharacterized delta-60 repeat protein
MLAAGDLDTTFGTGGQVDLDLGILKSERIMGSAIQADGKIVVVGSTANTSGSQRDFLIARFNTNGTLDSSFGTGGFTTVDVSDPGTGPNNNQSDEASDVVIQPDGSIIVTGTAVKNTGVSTTNVGVAVVKLTTSGQLDTSFDGDGKTIAVLQNLSAQNISVMPVNGAGTATIPVALQSNGKIVVGATTSVTTGTRDDFAVLRLNANGSLDTSFSGDGYAITDFDSTSAVNATDALFDIAIQTDGRIVAVGNAITNDVNPPASQDFAIARYNTDGSLDTTFDGDGKVTTDLAPTLSSQSTANSVVIEPDGQLVVGGWTTTSGNRDFVIARYNLNGALDTTFASASVVPGTLRITFGAADFGEDLILQPMPDGKYIIGGYIGTTAATSDFALARVNLNGTLDTSFSGDGRTQTHFASATSFTRLTDLSIQADGKVVAVGYLNKTGGVEDIALARFETGLVVNTITGLGEINEGTNYTLHLTSNDPAAEDWFIDWGDGHTETVLGNPSSASHLYADGTNTYTINATVFVDDDPIAAGSRTVKVNNVAPSLTVDLGSLVLNEGQTATNSGTYGDVPDDTVTLTVGASIGTVTNNNDGTWSWWYDTVDDFVGPVTITATDEDGGVTVVAFNLEVKNVNPLVTVDQTSVVAEVNQTVTNSGTVTDVLADGITLIASIGTVVNNNDGTWSWSYTTGIDPPDQTVAIAALDDDGGFGMVTFSLSVEPTLTVVPDQTANEGAPININDLGTFTDIVQAGNEGWPVEIGLDANDFTAIGAFDPTSNVVINTDTLTISGGFSGVGTTVTANTGFGNYQIAVFTFDNFELDAGITITATGSRPLAILSQGNMLIEGVIDVSATSDGLPGNFYERIAGAGGGNGGLANSTNTLDQGDAAAGAPANGGGLWASADGSGGAGGGSGGAFGGRGGRAENNPSGGLAGIATVGQPYANLAAGIQGGSGGGTASAGFSGTLRGGGGGGGGIELGAVGVITVASGAQVLANGGEGQGIPTTSMQGAGGGGAGGGILLHATSVNQHGTLQADGGNGGGPSRNGGGGGGGAILIVHHASGSFDNTGGMQSVAGGTAGPGGGGESGLVGVLAIQADTPAATPVFETFDYVIDWGDGSSLDSGAATIDTPGVNIGDIVQGSIDGSHIYADNGVYTVTVTINDSSGGSDTKTFDVTVNNVDPALTVDQALVTVDEGQSAINIGTYGDVAADVVSISASAGTVIDNGDGTWVWSFNSTDGPVQSQTVTITAEDEDGGLTNVMFDLTVDNLSPTLTVDQAAIVANEGQMVTNSGTYGDVPADTVSVAVSIGTVVLSSGVWNWSYTAADGPAAQVVTITATDGEGGLTEVTFNLTVNNVDPTANAGGPYFTFDDTPITLIGSGSDVADPLSFDWDLDNNGTFETAGQNAVFNPQALGFTGTQTRIVNLRVTDGDGGQAISTATVEILGVGTALIGGVLHVVGSDFSDIVIITRTSSNIMVIASFNDDNPMLFNTSTVTEIQVRTRGSSDIVVTTPNVTQLISIDGGSGNDLLAGGGGRNVITGGLGHDIIHGSAGDDVLLGGDGNDDIFGGSGYDVLVGGNGNDILDGGTGRDLIIGSQDEDTLKGGNDDDILIGGFTSHDNNVAALDAIMAIWGSSANFSSRVATLTGLGGLLQAGVTVFDDDADDTIMGNAGRDLVFGDTNPWDGALDTISLHPLQDVLIAVN